MGKTRVISKGYRHGTRDKWAKQRGELTIWAMEIPVCWGSFIEGSLKVLLMAPVEVGSLSHDLKGFYTSQVVSRISEPSTVASDLSEVLWQFRLYR